MQGFEEAWVEELFLIQKRKTRTRIMRATPFYNMAPQISSIPCPFV